MDWIPAFLNGLYSNFTIDVELQEYKGERKVVLRIDTPIEFQRDMKYLGKSFELVNLVIDAQGYTGDAWGTVDEEIRKAYPNFTGEKKYSMQITFADKEACLENPYGYYLIIDRDLNVYTELILHSGTKAVIYYDGEPVYDATQDLTSLQRLDEATAKGIIELLMKNGFSFTRTESVSGEEQHTNAAQIAGENQTNTNDIIDKYKNFIASQNELLFYSIYDIDKDGYPELFFYENHPQERESFCDIYSYSGDEFKLIERTHGPGFWHVLPIYASYPNGNGIVEYGAVKGYEFVDVHTLNDGILNTEEVYYSREGAKYYLDSSDQTYYESQYNNPINHQYYQSETSSPYFEGSYLLGSNAKDNFTAVYEAFGVENVQSVAIDENNAEVIDLYEYRKTDVWELAEMIGGMSQGDGEGIILGSSSPNITIAAFVDTVYGTGTNYIGLFERCDYTIGGIMVGDSVASTDEKILALGFDLYEDGMQAYGNPWKEYRKGMESLSYHWDTDNSLIEDIVWGEYHD